MEFYKKMKKEFEEKLYEDFPLLFGDCYGNPQNTCMCFGFSCDDGWEPIIRELAQKLEPLIQKFINKNFDKLPCKWCNINKLNHDKGWSIEQDDGTVKHYLCHGSNGYEAAYPRASQVKEKFAELHFYMTMATTEMYDLIYKFEKKSKYICEQCGLNGQICSTSADGSYGWLKTLCLKCATENNKYFPIKSKK